MLLRRRSGIGFPSSSSRETGGFTFVTSSKSRLAAAPITGGRGGGSGRAPAVMGNTGIGGSGTRNGTSVGTGWVVGSGSGAGISRTGDEVPSSSGGSIAALKTSVHSSDSSSTGSSSVGGAARIVPISPYCIAQILPYSSSPWRGRRLVARWTHDARPFRCI